jgi:hypothetical protein
VQPNSIRRADIDDDAISYLGTFSIESIFVGSPSSWVFLFFQYYADDQILGCFSFILIDSFSWQLGNPSRLINADFR